MNALKQITLILTIVLLGASGMLFGCGELYSKMSIELSTENIVLYLNSDEEDTEDTEEETTEDITDTSEEITNEINADTEESSTQTFVATIKNLPGGVVNDVTYYQTNDNIVLIEQLSKSDVLNEITLQLTALNAGQTTVVITTAEGNKQATLNVLVNEKIEALSYNASYNQIFEVATPSSISTTSALNFVPATTNQKDIIYSLFEPVEGVTVSESGLVTATSAVSGFVYVVATSAYDTEINQMIPIKIIEPFTTSDLVLQENGVNVESEEILLATNNISESQILSSIFVDTEEAYKVTYSVENQTLLEVERYDNISYILRSARLGDTLITARVELIGYDYYVEKQFDVNIKEYPTSVNVTSETDDIYEVSGIIENEVLDNYVDNLGKPFTLSVGAVGAYNKQMRIYIRDENGLMLENGTVLQISYSDGTSVNIMGATEGDILPNNITIYIKALQTGITANVIIVSVPSIDTLNLQNLDDAVKTTLEISLKQGATSLTIDQESLSIVKDVDATLSFSVVPAQSSIKGLTFEYSNEGIVEEIQSGEDYIIRPLKTGNTRITLLTANGITDSIEVEVYNLLTDAGLMLQTPSENNDVGELNYSLTDNGNRTIESATISIGSGMALAVNKYPADASIINTIYSSSDSSIATISSMGYIIAKTIGTVQIEVGITSLTSISEGVSEEVTRVLSFELNTYVQIDEVSLNYNQTELLDSNGLGYYDLFRSKLQLELNITPIDASFSTEDIEWSISNNYGTVSQDGLVSVSLPAEISVASTTITATIKEFDRYYTQTCVITINKIIKSQYVVVENVYNDSLYFDARLGLGEIYEEDNGFMLESKIYPTNADNQEVIYSYVQDLTDLNSEPVVIVRDDGTIIPNRAGNAYVYVMAEDSFTDQDTATVYKIINVKVADGLTLETALEVDSAEDLFGINTVQGLSLNYALTRTIDLTGVTFETIGIIDDTLLGFDGTLIGELDETTNQPKYSIIGINYVITSIERVNNIGLFAMLNSGSIVKNIKLEIMSMDLSLESNDTSTVSYVGGLVAQNNGTIQDVSVNIATSEIITASRSNYIGGIAGINNGTISFDGDVASENPEDLMGVKVSGVLNVEERVSQYNTSSKIYLGGIAGYNTSTIEANFDFYSGFVGPQNSYVNATISIDASNTTHTDSATGGLVGFNSGTVQNLATKSNVIGLNNVGGAIGISVDDVANLYASGFVTGTNCVAGLVGYNTADIGNSIVEILDIFELDQSTVAQITGVNFVGGLVGYVESGNISYSYVRSFYERAFDNDYVGDVVVELLATNTNTYIGGLVGYMQVGQILLSCSNVNIYVDNSSGSVNNVYAGGILGANLALVEIENCYSKGNINASAIGIAGGIVGYLEVPTGISPEIINTYAINTMTASVTGGIVGVINNNGSSYVDQNNFYWDNITSATAVGTSSTLAIADTENGETLEDIELAGNLGTLQLQATFTSYDFVNNWNIGVEYNEGTPYLIDASGNSLIVEPPTALTVTVKDGIESLSTVVEEDITNNHFKIDDSKAVVYYYSGSDSLNIYDINNLISKEVYPITANITWVEVESSNTDVAILKNGYELLVLNEGLTKITITSILNKEVYAEFELVVIKPLIDFGLYASADTTLNGTLLEDSTTDILSLKKDEYQRLYPTIYANIDEQEYSVNETYEIKYSTTDASIAKFDGYNWVPNINIASDSANVIKALVATLNDSHIEITAVPTLSLQFENSTETLDISFLQKSFGVKVNEGSIALSLETSEASISLKDIFILDVELETDIPLITKIMPEKILVIDEYKNNVERLVDGTYISAYDELDINTYAREVDGNLIVESFKIEVSNKNNTTLYNEEQTYKITFASYDSNVISEGTVLEQEFILNIIPQDVYKIDMNYYAASEVYYNEDDEAVYNPNELPSTSIVTGKTGMLKLNIYPSFASAEYVDLKFNVEDTVSVSFEQFALDMVEGEQGNDYVAVVPQAEIIEDGIRLRLISNMVADDGQESLEDPDTHYEFDGSLYVKLLIASGITIGTQFTVTATSVDELANGVLVDKLTTTLVLDAEPESTIKLSYAGTGGYFAVGTTTTEEMEIEAIYTKINPEDGVTFNINGTDIVLGVEEQGITITENVDRTIIDGYFVYKYYSLAMSSSVVLGSEFTIKAESSKVINNKTATYITDEYNDLNLIATQFTVESFVINDLVDDYFVKAHGGIYSLDITIDPIYDESNSATAEAVSTFNTDISNSANAWYQRVYGSTSTTDTIFDYVTGEYYNYYVEYRTAEEVAAADPDLLLEDVTLNMIGTFITPKKISTNDVILAKINFSYVNGVPTPELSANLSSVSNDTNADGENDYLNGVVLERELRTDFYLKINEDKPTPIYDEDDLINMQEGVDYILLNDESTDPLVLEDWVPLEMAISSLDGNGRTITIESFADDYSLEEEVESVSVGNFGLFGILNEVTTLKNIEIDLTGLTLDVTKYLEINFGGLVAQNDGGIIYNCHTYSTGFTTANLVAINSSPLINEQAVVVNVGGMVAQNDGYITNSRSEVKITSDQGNLAGFVSENNGIIASCYYKEGVIINESQTKVNSTVGGFVCYNTSKGEIRYSYVEGYEGDGSLREDNGLDDGDSTNYRINGGGLLFSGNIGGFVYQNQGAINDAYSNIKIEGQGNSAGFVYINRGSITNAHTMSLVVYENASKSPFVGVDEQGDSLNDGGICTDCYYLDGPFANENLQPATVTKTAYINNRDTFVGYSFSNNALNGAVWELDETYGYPILVAANDKASSERVLKSSVDEEYEYVYVNGTTPGTDLNPIILFNAEQFNEEITMLGQSDIFIDSIRIIKDFDFEDLDLVAETISVDFAGVLDGNGMTISGVKVVAGTTTIGQEEVGLFRSITTNNENVGIVKNLTLNVEQVYANETVCVGALAGIIDNGNVYNVVIDGENVVVEGSNIVGGLAGKIMGASDIVNVAVSLSINSSYREGLDFGTESTATTNLPYQIYFDGVPEEYIDVPNGVYDLGEPFVDTAGGIPDVYDEGETFTDLGNENGRYDFAEEFEDSDMDGIHDLDELNYLDSNGNDEYDVAEVYTDSNNDTYYNGITDYLISYAGVIAGIIDVDPLDNAQIINVSVYGNSRVIGQNVGTAFGLIGQNTEVDGVNVTIEESQFIKGTKVMGGIVAENRGLINNASFEHKASVQVNIDSAKSGVDSDNRNKTFFSGVAQTMGGIVGFNNGGTITNSYSKVDVRNENVYTAGGLIGRAVGGTIDNCYVTGSVLAKEIMGGLIGANVTNVLLVLNEGRDIKKLHYYIINQEDLTITNCSAINNWLISDYEYLAGSEVAVGGFIGAMQASDVANASEYFDEYLDDLYDKSGNTYVQSIYSDEDYDDTDSYFLLNEYGVFNTTKSLDVSLYVVVENAPYTTNNNASNVLANGYNIGAEELD